MESGSKNYGLGEQPNIADLAALSSDELFELARKRKEEERNDTRPLVAGLRRLADMIEATPDLAWRNMLNDKTVNAFHHGVSEDPLKWQRETAAAIGGEWEDVDNGRWLIKRQKFGPITLDLNVDADDVPKATPEPEPKPERKLTAVDVSVPSDEQRAAADDARGESDR